MAPDRAKNNVAGRLTLPAADDALSIVTDAPT